MHALRLRRGPGSFWSHIGAYQRKYFHTILFGLMGDSTVRYKVGNTYLAEDSGHDDDAEGFG